MVCGRNEKLKQSLASRDWAEVFQVWQSAKNRDGVSKSILSFGDTCGSGISTNGCIQGVTVSGSIRRMLSSGSLTVGNAMADPNPLPSPGGSQPVDAILEEKKAEEAKAAVVLDDDTKNEQTSETHDAPPPEVVPTSSEGVDSIVDENTRAAGNVHVVGLGFVTRMAEYMVAADILVSKAGPGTISEAAALSLPVMLTSFLPGQEEGNVDFVVNGGFGAYVNDSDPIGIAEEVCMWLRDDDRRTKLSVAAKAHGAPWAARDIVKQIGDSTLKWREINREKDIADAAAALKDNEDKQNLDLPLKA